MKQRSPDRFHLRQLRGRHIRFVRRGHVYLFGVDCTDSEWGPVTAIPADMFATHARFVLGSLGLQGWFPRIRVLCVGASSDFSGFPKSMPHSDGLSGWWSRRADLAVIRLRERLPLRNVLMHELTHALLDIATDGFPYVRAIYEGFAVVVDRVFGDFHDLCRWPGGERSPLTIWAALNVNPRQLYARDGQARDPVARWKFYSAGTWLILWLARLSEQNPDCSLLLPILYRRGIRTPRGVYEVLQELTRMNAPAMEASYRSFTLARR